jgi:hypothetical protein
MSVRREGHSRRQGTVERLLGAAFGTGVAVAFVLQFGCDGWPPGDRNDSGTTGGGVQNTNGTCSGLPIPCAQLVGADCSSNLGCRDNGSCVGTATAAGFTCATSSPTVCAGTPGCFWSGPCTGTPLGTCSAFTESACLQAKGCVWTPNGGGAGGSASTCQTYLAPCTTAAMCDCGFTCIIQCPTCGAVCGTACQIDATCTGTSNLGVPTPYCHLVQGGSSGLCSQTR